MIRFTKTVILMLVCMGIFVPATQAQDELTIEYEKYTLDNGLQVILHEDHSIPMASVNIWYHVGSKNEKPGRTGFAHLFEHMMFQGSKNNDDDYFNPIERMGGVVNGSTTEDRTNYWENVPSDQLETALWLEADRMGFLLDAMTEEKLANQKDVVRNEKREGMNNPYNVAYDLIPGMLYPNEHPYSWTVLGSMEDLGAASKEDVSEFFRLYYAPNNASLCVAGDFDPVQVKAWIDKYFATLPPGRKIDRTEIWVPRLTQVRRMVAEDNVEVPRLFMAWHTPGWYQPGDAEFDLLSEILVGGKTSRLYKTLVYDLQVAQDVDAYQESREVAGDYIIEASPTEGHTLEELEELIDAELRKIFDKGINKGELKLAKTTIEANFIRSLQRVGGFGGKADRLNNYNTLTGDPGYLAGDMARFRDATTKGIQGYAREYLHLDQRVIIHVLPQGTLSAAEMEFDRSVKPGDGPLSDFNVPSIQRARLDNGLELYLVEKHNLPLVDINLVIMSGWAADDKPGTASLTAALLDEGTKKRNALEIAQDAKALGARLGTYSFFDGSGVSLNVIKENLDDGLSLMSDLILNPAFPEEELERQRQLYLGRLRQEAANPQVLALKGMQQRLFSDDHPYAQSFTGNGTPASLAALNRADLVGFHKSNYLPENAGVVIVGDLDMDEAKRRLARAFKNWSGGSFRGKAVAKPVTPAGPRVLIIDRPGSPQSMIMAGHLSLENKHADMLGYQLMNTALGGQFWARINMNLREDKGYTYGAFSNVIGLRHSGVFMVIAPIQTQFTKEAIVEILAELNDVRGPRPMAGDELQFAKNSLMKGFPQRFETFGAISGQLQDLVLYDQDLDDWRSYLSRVEAYDEAKVARIVQANIRPDDLLFVIAGDAAVIEPTIRELNLGEIKVISADDL
ncbi:MAG: insulinase family protein [bacterium]|nr:insulinase family protein [bacterium]